MALSVGSGIGFDEAGRGFQPYDYIQMIYPAIGGRFAALYFGLLPLGPGRLRAGRTCGEIVPLLQRRGG